MPFGGMLTAGIGGLASSLLGGIAGATNTRPPSLSPGQSSALSNLLGTPGQPSQLLQTAMGTPKIDPVQQNLMYGSIAANQTGGMDAVTHALVSRGLGHSGLLGGALTQVANQAQAGRNQADLGLQQQAIQQKQLSIQDILGLLGVNNTPGQSGAGGFFAGMAPVAAYSIQSAMNRNNNSGSFPGQTFYGPTSMS